MWHMYPRSRLLDGFWQEESQDWCLSFRFTPWRRSRPESCLRRAGPRKVTDPRRHRRLWSPQDPFRALMHCLQQNHGNHVSDQWRERCGKERDFEDSIGVWDPLSWVSSLMRPLIFQSLRRLNLDTCAGRQVFMREMLAVKKSR